MYFYVNFSFLTINHSAAINMGLEEAVLALHAIRKSRKKKVQQETQNSLRRSLPSTYVKAVDFSQALSPRSTPIRRMAAQTIRNVRFSNAGREDICEFCHQRRPTSVASEGDIHSYLSRTSRGVTPPVQGNFISVSYTHLTLPTILLV